MSATAKFFLLTFAITWGAQYVAMRGMHLIGLTIVIGLTAPAIVGIALTYHTEGETELRALLARLFIWDVPLRWYAFAVALMPVTKLLVALLFRLGYGHWPTFGTESWYVMAFVTITSTLPQAAEEIGWRGFALPRMSASMGAGPASLVLGVLWAAWHLPGFFIEGSGKYGQSLVIFTFQLTAFSVFMAWVYFRTRGSLLLMMLMHSAWNQWSGIVPSSVVGADNPWALSTSPVAWLTVGVLWVGAGYCLVRMRATAREVRLTPA